MPWQPSTFTPSPQENALVSPSESELTKLDKKFEASLDHNDENVNGDVTNVPIHTDIEIGDQVRIYIYEEKESGIDYANSRQIGKYSMIDREKFETKNKRGPHLNQYGQPDDTSNTKSVVGVVVQKDSIHNTVIVKHENR
eukprot:UN03575